MAVSAVIPGQTEVQADGFGMAYMQEPVGLRRESGADPVSVLSVLEVLFDDGA
jgi:hypothetical protein